MEKQMRRNLNDGITLIALIVTIVLLLVLAGIAVNIITGDRRYFSTFTKCIR